MSACYFCGQSVNQENDENYKQVSSWVNGPKLDGPVMREQTGAVAHKDCVDNLVKGQAPDQPMLDLGDLDESTD